MADVTRPSARSGGSTELVDHLVALSVRGLSRMYVPETHEFVQTIRGLAGPKAPSLAPEGRNLRYAAIAALGLSLVDPVDQRLVLAGDDVRGLVGHVVAQARTHADPGAVALGVWAAAEVAGAVPEELLRRLSTWLESHEPLHTVDVAWMLTAAVAAQGTPGADHVAQTARDRLLGAAGGAAVFPHVVPAASQSRLRAHVGSFADQVYPLQALARYAAGAGDEAALAASERTAQHLCDLQGEQGQWWWHYDTRDGSVVEPFPVYSVHQHAMAPMVLFDLEEAGGRSHAEAALRGLSWLRTHPESFGELIDDTHDVVWRKVGRREPRKAARTLNAVASAVRAGLRVPGLDAALPVGVIDHECRPYELGWLLYAWGRDSGRRALADGATGVASQPAALAVETDAGAP